VVPDEPGNAFERLTTAGVDVVRMPLGRLRRRLDWRLQRDMLFTMAGDLPRLVRLVRREHIDLVVIHGLVNPQAGIAARICRRPVVWQVLDLSAPRPLRIAVMPLVRALSSSVMTTGIAVADAHPGLPRGRTRLYQYFPPVDTRLFSPNHAERNAVRAALGFSEHHTVIGCVANFTPEKGLDRFLSVARSVCELRPAARFALFGRPMETHADYARRLLSSSLDLQRHGRIVVLDEGPDVPTHLRALDVFLATSRSEGIPTTVLEAMSSGIAVIATDVGGTREAVTHGVDGYLAAPDDRAALVDYVLRLIDDPRRRGALAAAARERAVSEFDVEQCADIHARAFEVALGHYSR
jgi:glycosyltransferase involved in cell wall biosynthesis